MTDLLSSLAIGIILIIAVNGLLFRLTSLTAKQTAGLVGLVAVAIYLPLAVLYWPGLDIMAMHLGVYLLSCYAFGLIMGSRERALAEGRSDGNRFHWGPAAIIGFFVVLVTVDSIFIILAERGLSPQVSDKLLPDAHTKGQISSVFPGVISHDFQEKEALYNEYLRQVERQQERGWRIKKGWLERPVLGESAVFQVAARTPDGDPISDAEVTGNFLRPSDSRLDRAFTMQETSSGVYQTTLALPAAGLWNLVLQVRKGDEVHEIRARTSVLDP